MTGGEKNNNNPALKADAEPAIYPSKAGQAHHQTATRKINRSWPFLGE